MDKKNVSHERGHPHRQPVTPTNTEKGLSSPVNRRYMLEILKVSDLDQISDMLRQAGYRAGPGTPHLDAATEKHAEEYLQTDAGRQLQAAATDLRIQQVAEKELESEVGRRRLDQVRAQLAAKSLAQDVDVFGRLCQEEIRKQAQAWLRTEAGRESVEMAKQRAAEREARAPRFCQKPMREESPA